MECMTYVLVMIDALAHLPSSEMEQWLDITVKSLDAIPNEDHRMECLSRLWEMLNGGSLDLNHADTSVIWWTSKGGMEMAMHSIKRCTSAHR